MLVAHSMGSIVAYDVLSFYKNNPYISTFVTMGSPLGLPIVESKIFEEFHEIQLEPKTLITPNSIVEHWYNFSDIHDKVAFNFKLSDDYAANDGGVKPVDFLVNNDYSMNGKANPHKSFGYLRAPEFSKILQKFILEEEPAKGKRIRGKLKHILIKVKGVMKPVPE